VLAAEVTVWPIVIGFVVAMAAFGGSVVLLLRDSERVQPRIQRAPPIPSPPRVEPPLAPVAEPQPPPARPVPSWRVGTAAATFFVLSTWSTWTARARHSARH
jgi:hypothetical protein